MEISLCHQAAAGQQIQALLKDPEVSFGTPICIKQSRRKVGLSRMSANLPKCTTVSTPTLTTLKTRGTKRKRESTIQEELLPCKRLETSQATTSNPDLPKHLDHQPYAGTSVWDQHPAKKNWIHGAKEIKSQLQVGTIFLAPCVEPLFNPAIPIGHRDRGETRIGAISAKRRPYILLLKCQAHLVAIPLFTFQGEGIGKKTRQMQEEYVSVVRPGDQTLPQGPHESLIVEEDTTWNAGEISVAHFTMPQAISYSCPVQPLGYIIRESYIHLSSMYREALISNLDENMEEMEREIEAELSAKVNVVGGVSTLPSQVEQTVGGSSLFI
ncbi:MAG: hypothetical protein Q9157_002311 [Trypethelium eluteriae]